MALEACPECSGDVSSGASACPKCGKKDPTGAQAETTAKGCIGCLGLVLVILLVSWLMPDSGPRPLTDEDERIAVSIACGAAVRAQLRSPSTASFPFAMSRGVSIQSPTSARLAAYVDAQNAFGAEVRTQFLCLGTKSAGRWSVEATLIN